MALLLDPPPDKALHPLDPLEVYKLRLQHRLTFQQIAGLFGVTKQAVHECFTKFSESIGQAQDVTSYTNAKADLLSLAEERLVATCLDPAKLEKASLNNVAYAFTQIHTALRLEKNQSTRNLGMLGKIIVQADDGLFTRPTPPPVVAGAQDGKVNG